jgi:lipoate-protein ligase A
MAVDEALLRLSREPVLRIYGWNEAAVSLGYFQKWVLAGDRPFVRRYTGGGLVDHAADFTYTVVFPQSHPWLGRSLLESYSEIHRGVVQALAGIGIEAVLAKTCDAHESSACFQKAVKFDVKVGDEKVAGAAQRRTREGVLQQGSILLGTKRHDESFRQALPQALAEIFQEEMIDSVLSPDETALAANLAQERYGTKAWNQRR